jgi:aminopeptidase N
MGVDVYMQSAYIMRYLEDVLGKEEFDRIMRKYYRTYQFKHVYPEDMRALFEAETGEKFCLVFLMV